MSDHTTPQPEYKTCTKCGERKPATAEYFCRHKGGKSGLSARCKECHRNASNQYYYAHGGKPQVKRRREGQKQCSCCEQWYPATTEYFNKAGNRKDGLYPECKACKARKDELSRRAKGASPKEETRRNNQKRCSGCKEWFELTPEFWFRNRASNDGFSNYCKECATQQNHEKYRRLRENPDYVSGRREYDAEYRRLHPEKGRARSEKRRARIANADGKHSANDIASQLKGQNGRCWWCGKKLKANYHVDHLIPITRGGSNGPENLVISCPRCNQSKGNKMPWEWNGRLL